MAMLCYPVDVAPSDLELLERWRSGDAAAGEALFERHFDAVVRFFRNKTDGAADDLVQKTFLGCVRGQERFRGESSFRTYLFVVAHNVLKNHYREQRRAEVDFGVSSVFELAPSPSTIVAQQRTAQLLLAALRRIPLELQVALELHYWEGLSSTEIGAVLELPTGTVKTRLRRAKQLLGQHMQTLNGRMEPLVATEDDLEKWARAVRHDLLAD